MTPPPLSPRPNPGQEEFLKTQQRSNSAALLRAGSAKRGGEMAAPYGGGLLEAPRSMTHAAKGDAVGAAKRGGGLRGAKSCGAFDGGLLAHFNHEQKEQRQAEQRLRSPYGPSRRGPHAPCTCMHSILVPCACTGTV